MKKPNKLKNRSAGTGDVRQRRRGAKSKRTVAKRNARLKTDPEFAAKYIARKATYLSAQKEITNERKISESS